MTGQKTRALQVPQIVPYNALGKFPKEVLAVHALWGARVIAFNAPT